MKLVSKMATTLFPLTTKSVSTDEELRLEIEKFPEYHPTYLNVSVRKDWRRVRDFFENEWLFFQKFADKDFHSEFMREFTPRAWEIYLFSLFRSRGFSMISQSKKLPNPDLKIKLENNFLFIEAVTAGKGSGVNEVKTLSDRLSETEPGTIASGVNTIDESNHPKVRRILNALDTKITNMSRHKSVVANNDFYMIAVNAADIDGYMMGDELILEAVAGINPAVHIPFTKNGQAGPSYKTIRNSISNARGTKDIDLGIFNSKEANILSAVLYFGSNTFNAVLYDRADEAVIIHNPHAEDYKKINPALLLGFRQIIFTPEGYEYVVS